MIWENLRLKSAGFKVQQQSLPYIYWDAGVAALQSGGLTLAENLAALLVYSHHIGLQSLPDQNAKGKRKCFPGYIIFARKGERLKRL